MSKAAAKPATCAHPRLRVFLISVAIIAAGFGLAGIRIAGHKVAPELLPKMTYPQLPHDMYLRIAAVIVAVGLLSLVRVPFVRVAAAKQAQPKPTKYASGQLTYGSMMEMSSDRAAQPPGGLRKLLASFLTLAMLVCVLGAGACAVIFATGKQIGTYPKEIALAGAGGGLVAAIALWLVKRAIRRGKSRSQAASQQPVGAGAMNGSGQFQWSHE